MHEQLLIAIVAGLGGMLGWGLADFFAKKTIDKVGDMVSLAWGHIFGTLTLFLIIFFDGKEIEIINNISVWSMLIFFGILQAIVYIFLYRGFGQGQVGLLSPIFASFSGITALFSIVIFKELVSAYLLAGLAVIFLGILLINVDVKALKDRKFGFTKVPGFSEVAIATILAALWTLFWDRVIGGKDWLTYTTFMYLFMTIAILIICKLKKINIFVIEKGLWKFLVLIGVCEVVAYLAISSGYSLTSLTSVVALLSGAFSLPVIILAKIFLKERISRVQTIGSIVVIIGIMLVAVL